MVNGRSESLAFTSGSPQMDTVSNLPQRATTGGLIPPAPAGGLTSVTASDSSGDGHYNRSSSSVYGSSSSVVTRVKSIVSRASARVLPLSSGKGPKADLGRPVFRSNTMGAPTKSPSINKSPSSQHQDLRHHSDPAINADTKNLKSSKKKKGEVLKIRNLVQKFAPRSNQSLPRISGRKPDAAMSHYSLESKSWQGQPVEFKAWRSKAPPGVEPFRELDIVKNFWVYCVQLPGIEDVFKDEHQHWCRSNENARVIFHPQTQKPQIRSGCRGVHQGITTAHGCCTQKKGTLKCANHLYGMLQTDADEYLYSLIDCGLYLVDSRAALPRELLSKHAILADGEETVRCAGELRLEIGDKGTQDEKAIVLDNRSGTYAPGKHSLELTQTLLMEHFPDAVVKIINVDADEVDHEHVGQRSHRGTTVLREDVSYRDPSTCEASTTSWNDEQGLGVRVQQSMMSVRSTLSSPERDKSMVSHDGREKSVVSHDGGSSSMPLTNVKEED